MTDLPPIALTPESTIEFASRCEAARIRGATRHTNASVLARGPDSVLVRASVRLGRPGNTVAGFYRFTIGGFRRVSAALVRRAGNLHSPVGNATLRVYVLNFAPQSADPRLVIEALDTDTPAPILDREYELTAMSGGRHAPADRPPGRYRATLEPTTETPQRSVVPLEAGDHGVVMVVIEPGGQTTLLTARRTRD